eukprot:TRINITY_DN34034_c0_g1_i2.p1 TRINITY_DN34034_c0_g1~~TRINITY_DN34034_c0_g1_i2.p1  ORF type:complete len:777 (-),score=171.94 TRINITY_DN34034_c0_g1_i2:289-2619(-)
MAHMMGIDDEFREVASSSRSLLPINTTIRTTTTMPDWYDCSITNSSVVSPDISTYSIYQACVLNGFTFICMVVLFLAVFYSRHLRKALAPEQPAHADGEGGIVRSWLRPIFYDDERRPLSLDAQVLIGLCNVGAQFSFIGSIVACVLVPLYKQGSMAEEEDVDNFLQFTVSNLDTADEWIFWVVVAASYLMIIVFFLLMRRQWKWYIGAKREHFLNRAEGKLGHSCAQAQYSLMLERIPPMADGEGGIREKFDAVFKSVHSCVLQADTLALYEKVFLVKTCGCCGDASRAKKSYVRGVETVIGIERGLAQTLRKAQATLTHPSRRMLSTGFVTLKSVVDRQVALQQVSLFHSRSLPDVTYADWLIQAAPEPRDIIWRNITIPHQQVKWRSWATSIALFFLLIFWSGPVLFVQAASSPQNLHEVFPEATLWLQTHSPMLYGLIVGYLGVLALQGLLLLLPHALEWISTTVEGRKLKSSVARKMLLRNVQFQLASLYMLAIGGVMWDSYKEILTRPFCSGAILGVSIPKVSVYFMIFVLARVGTTLPLLLLRVPALAGGAFKACTSRKPAKTDALEDSASEDEDEEEETPPVFCWWGYEGTNLVIVLVLGTMYCIISPLIMPICFLYFVVAGGVHRWMFTNVYAEEFDGEGCCWSPLFNGSTIGMLLGTITLCGVAGLKFGVQHPAFFIMWLLPLLIIRFQYYCHKRYAPYADYMPFEDAVSVDRGVGPEIVSAFDSAFYKDPILTLDVDSIAVMSDDNEESVEMTDSGSEASEPIDL